MIVLSAAQLRIVNAIRAWTKAHELPPTLMDIARLTSKGKTTVSYHVRRLTEAGVLDRMPGKYRTIQINTDWDHKPNAATARRGGDPHGPKGEGHRGA